MKCQRCNGVGYIYKDKDCCLCDGTGIQPKQEAQRKMTEEEAREMLRKCICTESRDLRVEATIKNMRIEGYIARPIWEEAEELIMFWGSSKEMDIIRRAFLALKEKAGIK